VAKFDIPQGWTAQAYRFALDPSLAQLRAFRSHAGGARKAYNTMLALVKAVMGQRQAERSYGIAEADLTPALSWSLAGLRREWNRHKGEAAPWWAENSKECYSSGLDALARGLGGWSKSRKGERAGPAIGFPKFKSARSAGGAYKKGLNLALSDAALAEIRRMLTYKCTWYGSTLVEAGRFFPSSKLCSGCGRRKPNLTLADRPTNVTTADCGPTVISTPRSTSPGSARPGTRCRVNRAPPGVARWQDAEPPVRPSPRERATQEAVKRQPRTGSRRTRRGPPHRKARLPDEYADSPLLI